MNYQKVEALVKATFGLYMRKNEEVRGVIDSLPSPPYSEAVTGIDKL